MKNHRKAFLLFFFLLVSVLACLASHTFRGLSLSDGLSDLLVNVIYKDSCGYVWLGTGNSLERFDGIRIKHYPMPGTHEKLKRVYAIEELPGNHLWVGNGEGLWRLNKTTDALEAVVSERIDCAVYSLLYLGNTLYIGTEKGLFLYRDGHFEQVLMNKNVFADANVVLALCEGQYGQLWLSTKDGLYAMNLSDRSMTPYHYVSAGKHTCAFHEMTRIGDVLYLGTMDQGIVSFNIRTHEFAPFVNVGCNVISSLSSDGKNLLYVGTDGNGVHFIDVSRREVVSSMRHGQGNDTGSLRSNSVYSLLVDRDGIIWVGFYQFGLDYTLYQNRLFSVYCYPPGFHTQDMPIRAIAIHGSEKLIGSRDGLFYIDEKRGIFHSFKVPQMRASMVFSILFYRGEYYVGTYGGGMYIFDPVSRTLRDFGREEPFLTGHIFCLREDADGRLWIGTSSGVYCYEEGRQIAHYTSANSKLPEGNVYEINFDSTRKGWICTENGMCIWDPSSSQLRTDVFPEGFVNNEKIRVVYEDSQHTLYFFPDKGDLFISDLSMHSFHRLQPDTPIRGKDGFFVIEDAEGWLWLGTSAGLYRYDKRDRFVPYNFVDGIPGPVFTLCPPVIDESGTLWLGNSKGLLHIDLTNVDRTVETSYPVAVTDVYVNGKPSSTPISVDADGHQRIALDASQKNVTFCFSDFFYTMPACLSYEYQLEDEDENWVSVMGISEVTYYDLSSGSYTFKVRRMGEPDTERRLSVNIATSWLEWAEWCVGILAVIAISGSVWYVRRRKGQGRSPEEQAMQPEPEILVTETSAKPIAEEKYRTLRLTAEECTALAERLEELMRKKKPYANSDLKIADLAAMLDTSAHTLSYLFNQHLNRNYYDYVNDFRIAEFKRLVEKEDLSRFTLVALAEQCGFSSRASFFRSFKKATGITPNEYIRSMEKGDK